MNRAIFLDRDGVLNRELGRYVTCPEEFELLPGVEEALQQWQDDGFQLFVMTNQGGIAKGLYSHEDLQKIHQRLQDQLEKKGIKIREIYYSPYHPDYCNSLNRKPGSLMFERAVYKHQIDPESSYVIGDSDRDMLAAEKLGIKGILVESNRDLREVLPKVK